jgi:hypothetical protein
MVQSTFLRAVEAGASTLLPPPSWGRVGEGGISINVLVATPTPAPSPQGGGVLTRAARLNAIIVS